MAERSHAETMVMGGGFQRCRAVAPRRAAARLGGSLALSPELTAEAEPKATALIETEPRGLTSQRGPTSFHLACAANQ